MPDRTGVNGIGGVAVPHPRRRASAEFDGHRCATRRLQRAPWRAAVFTLAFAGAAFVLAACDDCGNGGSGGSGVEYFPAGGVSESMRVARGNARLNLDHTVVT